MQPIKKYLVVNPNSGKEYGRIEGDKFYEFHGEKEFELDIVNGDIIQSVSENGGPFQKSVLATIKENTVTTFRGSVCVLRPI
jgi:hypothetical protein